MKIKNLFGMLAMAGMLFATSCSQDDVLNGAAAGDYVEAKFTIETPAAMATRGATNVGEGTTVNYVACAVYNAEGEELRNLRQYRPITDKTAIYSIRLVKGLGYRVAFFAYNGDKDGNSAYYNLADMTNIEINAAASNLEERDAFTNYVDVTEEESMNSIVKPVTLNRPFAQLNLGAYAEDIEAAALANIEVVKTEITVSNVYTAFSAYKNEVVGETTEVTFTMNDIPSQKLFVDTDNNESTADDEYEYLALNYLLVGDINNEKNLTDVTFKWTAANGKSNNPATVFQNIPVQRNYRTNVVGYLLTNTALFNVTIDEKFAGNNKPMNVVFDAGQLQAAIDAAPAGETLIRFGDDIVGDVTILQKEGVNLVIDGADNEYDGVMTINGNARGDGAETLKIENINFATSKELTFISAPSKINGKYNYSHNITIENCTFGMSQNTRSAEFNENIGSINLTGTYHLTVKGCKATGIHSLLQVQSCDNDVTVEGLTVENCKNGISLGNVANASISNVNIVAAGYGIRLDGATERKVSATIANSTISAFIPVNVRKMDNDACNVNVEFEGNNTLSNVGGGKYQVAFCSNEYKEGTEPVKPKGTYNEIPEAYTVYPEPLVAKVGNTEYTNIDEAIAAWTNNTTLTLLRNVTLNNVVTLKSTEYHILDLGTYTMTAAKGKDAISITAEGRTSASYALDIKADATNPGGITATSKAVVKTTGKSGVKDRPIIRFYNGVFNASNIISHSGSNGTNCPQFQFHGGVYNGSLSANRALIQIYGGTFNGKFYISVDSSAYALISGGKFKYLDNLYGSALNSDKFTIGSSKGNFDRGVYVDDEGYIVVGGAVITEFGDKFAAKATNASKAGSYLPYSSAAANGLYYTNAEMAIAKHGEANVVLK